MCGALTCCPDGVFDCGGLQTSSVSGSCCGDGVTGTNPIVGIPRPTVKEGSSFNRPELILVKELLGVEADVARGPLVVE